jgi:hypothetical protein
MPLYQALHSVAEGIPDSDEVPEKRRKKSHAPNDRKLEP